MKNFTFQKVTINFLILFLLIILPVILGSIKYAVAQNFKIAQSTSDIVYCNYHYTEWSACNTTTNTQTRQPIDHYPSQCTYNTPVITRTPCAVDTSEPYIFENVTSGTYNSGSFTFYTNEVATCKYSKSANVGYENMEYDIPVIETLQENSGISQGLSAALNSTTGGVYDYYIKCRDTVGNTNAADFVISFSRPVCSSFVYSDWSICQPSNTQTRTVVSSLPSGCTGGIQVLTQPCTYVDNSNKPAATTTNLYYVSIDDIIDSGSIDKYQKCSTYGNIGSWNMFNGHTYRYLSKLDLKNLVSASQVNKAVFKIDRVSTSWDDDDKYVLHKITSDWNGSTVTWNSQPSYNQAGIYPKKLNYGIFEFDVTNIVKEWLNNPSSNFGIMIKKEVENATLSQHNGQFACSTYPAGGAENRPVLEVTLNATPVVKTNPVIVNVNKTSCAISPNGGNLFDPATITIACGASTTKTTYRWDTSGVASFDGSATTIYTADKTKRLNVNYSYYVTSRGKIIEKRGSVSRVFTANQNYCNVSPAGGIFSQNTNVHVQCGKNVVSGSWQWDKGTSHSFGTTTDINYITDNSRRLFISFIYNQPYKNIVKQRTARFNLYFRVQRCTEGDDGSIIFVKDNKTKIYKTTCVGKTISEYYCENNNVKVYKSRTDDCGSGEW